MTEATELDRLTALFRALGADGDARDWAESEAEEGLPQLARYRLLRTVWQDVDAWGTAAPQWVAAYRTDGAAADAVDRALAAGLTPEDLGALAREVARETAFGCCSPWRTRRTARSPPRSRRNCRAGGWRS